MIPFTLAQEMFNAYNAQGPNPWKTFDGRDVPKWDELNDQVRAKWVAAANYALGIFKAEARDMLAEIQGAVQDATESIEE